MRRIEKYSLVFLGSLAAIGFVGNKIKDHSSQNGTSTSQKISGDEIGEIEYKRYVNECIPVLRNYLSAHGYMKSSNQRSSFEEDMESAKTGFRKSDGSVVIKGSFLNYGEMAVKENAYGSKINELPYSVTKKYYYEAGCVRDSSGTYTAFMRNKV